VSQANIDVVRRIYDAAARRDDETPFEVYAEDIICDISNSRPALLAMKPVYHGHEGVRQCWREFVSAFGEVDFEVEELTDAGDQVLAVIRKREVGRGSGVPVETTHLAVLTLSGGKVVQIQMFDDPQPAREAAWLAD
jgi:ketosteroid isomerase-like protein